jgi:uncharacterized OsmC-like protein
VGEVEKDGSVLVIRRIQVAYRLKGVSNEDRQTVERVNGFHADRCPVARSIRRRSTSRRRWSTSIEEDKEA